MSPIAQPPSRGYSDWQRVGNFDTGLLWQNTLTNSNANFLGPILDVSRFAYLSGTLQETQSISNVFVQWYSDNIQTQFMGQRGIVLSNLFQSVAQIRWPNLGPFCVVQQAFIGPTRFTSTVNIFATNRVHPLEFIPQNPILMFRQGSIPATTTLTFYPTDYYAGPINVGQFLSGGGTNNFSFECTDIAGNFDQFAQMAGGASFLVNQQIISPPGAWRVKINNNNAAAQTYVIAIVPSTTGAA